MSMICMPPAVCGAVTANQSLIDIITSLGLTTNLKLCLDAGDADSYDPGVQTAKWLDTSGNGYDFYRGSSTAGDASEPTFNGSAGGLSSSEYWSFDGDHFTYDTTNETWMESLHKDGAVHSWFGVINLAPAGGVTSLWSTRTTSATGAEVRFATTAGIQSALVANGASTVLLQSSTAAMNSGAWNVIGGSIDESVGADGLKFFCNGTTDSLTSTYSSPSAGAANHDMTLCARVAGQDRPPAGSKFACFAMWQGTALTPTNLSDLYNTIKGRFGL